MAETESLSPFGDARATVTEQPLSEDELDKINRYFNASLYLCLGMLYLMENPLLQERLKVEHIKPRLLGHWGSDPGQSFTYIHMNRLIKKYDLDADMSQDAEGMQRFFKQFSFPGGIGSHATPETPGSIHEGGELGYSISHAFGAVFDNPDLIALVSFVPLCIPILSS
jgi:xylulose-5-phosphate/fructose-6-phosphate phosphoketolase